MAVTSDSLITRVIRACRWSTESESLRPRTNADLLAIADEIILGTVWPTVLALSPDYYVCTIDHALVDGYSRYRLPGRIFGPVKDVLVLDADGNEANSNLITLEELGRLERLAGSRMYHYIDGDYLGVEPVPGAGVTDSIRIRYFRAPSTLALAATSTTVTACDFETDPDELTVDDGSVFTTGDDADVISAGSAHQVLAEDIGLTVAGNVLTSDTTLLGSGVQLGDYVAPAGTTPIVQVPDHATPWLVALIASEAMEHHDPQGSTRQAQRAAALLGNMQKISAPRTLSEPETLSDPLSPFEAFR